MYTTQQIKKKETTKHILTIELSSPIQEMIDLMFNIVVYSCTTIIEYFIHIQSSPSFPYQYMNAYSTFWLQRLLDILYLYYSSFIPITSTSSRDRVALDTLLFYTLGLRKYMHAWSQWSYFYVASDLWTNLMGILASIQRWISSSEQLKLVNIITKIFIRMMYIAQ